MSSAEIEESCSVSVDDVLGGALAVRHLIESGNERIVFVGGPPSLQEVRNRFTGARQVVAEAGLPPEALTVVETQRLDIAAGRDAGRRLLGVAARPTGVFCADELLALGVLQSLFAMGVRVPDGIALVATTTSSSPAPPRCPSPPCGSPPTGSAAPGRSC